MFKQYFIWILLLFVGAADAAELNSKLDSAIAISPELEVSFSKDQDYSKLEFSPNKNKSLSIGYTNDYVWGKFSVDHQFNQDQKIIFYIDSALAGVVELYSLENGSLVSIGKSGSEVPYFKRSIPSTLTAFQLNLPANSKHTYVFKRKGGHRLDGRVFLIDSKAFKEYNRGKDLIIFLYAGAVLAMLIYNLFIGLYTQSRAYYYYTGYLFFVAGVALNLIGGMDRIFTIPVSNYLMMFSSGAAAMSLAFTRNFITPHKYSKLYLKLHNIILAIACFHFVVYPLFRSSIGSSMGHSADLTIMSGVLLMFYAAYLGFKNNHPLAKFYLASWGVLLSSAVLWFGMTFGIFPQNILTKYSLMWGNVLEMLVLSLGLAFRIVLLNREKAEAEREIESQKKYRMLLRVLVHDISNPVTVLNHFGHLLDIKKDEPEEVKKLAQKATRASQLIGDIIESVRIQEVSSEVSFVPVSLDEMMESLQFIFQTRLQEKELFLEILGEKNLLVMADKSLLLNNVFSNIISNSIKFSSRGGKIEVMIESNASHATLIFRDYGKGFSDRQIQSFQSEGRIQTEFGTEGEAGTGYGMMVIKNFVLQFEGEIEIFKAATYFQDTSPGSVIKISLPKAS